MKVEIFLNLFIFLLGANVIKGVQGTKVKIFFQGLYVTCGHSYDILGAKMLWKPKEARILKKF
jgi:hypothetical protein